MKNKKLFTAGLSAFIYAVVYNLTKLGMNPVDWEIFIVWAASLWIAFSITFPLADVIFKEETKENNVKERE